MNDVISIATKVRRQCEIFAQSSEAKGHDFHTYFDKSDLACMCAVASYTLAKALNDNGIRCKMVTGWFREWADYEEQHCWVETHNKIIDITATQFGIKKPVFIVSRHHEKYHRDKIVRDPNELAGWGNQKPNQKLTKIILKIKIGEQDGY